MARMYFYKMTTDNGGAPHVRNGLLSLAICKPTLRRTAMPDDVVFGFAADFLRADNALIYAAVVTQVKEGGYYSDVEFDGRADRIYVKSGHKFIRRTDAKYHNTRDQMDRDLGRQPGYRRDRVLLSSDYRYFGKDANADCYEKLPAIKDALQSLGQGHRINHSKELFQQLQQLKCNVWKAPIRIESRPTQELSVIESCCCEGPCKAAENR